MVTGLLETVLDAVTFITGIRSVDCAAPIADLGIDSLEVAQVLIEVESRTGIAVRIEVLEQLDLNTTLEALVEMIAALPAASPSSR